MVEIGEQREDLRGTRVKFKVDLRFDVFKVKIRLAICMMSFSVVLEQMLQKVWKEIKQILIVRRMGVHLYVVSLQIILSLICRIKWASSAGLLCPDSCGNVTMDYPFGIGEGCYFDKSFEVICDHSSGSPKAFLASFNNLELSVRPGGDYDPSTIRVNVPVVSSKSSSNPLTSNGNDISGSPFTFIQAGNRFAAIGCNNYNTITRRQNDASVFGGCLLISTCDPAHTRGCYDFICALPPNVTMPFYANISHLYSQSIPQNCQSVSVVEEDWLNTKYLTDPRVLKNPVQVPALLGWAKYKGGCQEQYNSKTTCSKDKRGCIVQLTKGHICRCFPLTDRYCDGYLLCNSTISNNCSSGCPKGYETSYGKDGELCTNTNTEFRDKKSHVKFIIIGCSSGLGFLFLLVGTWWLYKFIKRRKEIKLKQKFFERNGGLLLQQGSSTNEGNSEKTKLFISTELEMATDNYNANRILGQGGQGTVYKGMSTDGKIVAVKKSKLVDESNVEQFINEVALLSQINHKNVVKLLGCCLETEVPILVYEFIPNGTLYQYIHDKTEEFPLTWEMRLRIAVEVSGALFYLHSAASVPIYHRDIKSANILLDDKYRAKVSDFGASKSVTIDQTHLTTRVQGTFGYLDPEYFRSSQFTDKSDVYSFGVVLVELLTGEKPIRSIDAEEDKSLAGFFLQAMKEDCLFEVLDARVLKEGEKEEIITVATLAKRCLHLNGKKRPSMKEVAFELGGIRASIGASVLQQNCEDIGFAPRDITGHLDTGSFSAGFILNSVAFSVDADPFISSKW